MSNFGSGFNFLFRSCVCLWGMMCNKRGLVPLSFAAAGCTCVTEGCFLENVHFVLLFSCNKGLLPCHLSDDAIYTAVNLNLEL
jgi:hypothetical protein